LCSHRVPANTTNSNPRLVDDRVGAHSPVYPGAIRKPPGRLGVIPAKSFLDFRQELAQFLHREGLQDFYHSPVFVQRRFPDPRA
jgi:hypothetical protein